jgi:hypothetical protein
MKDYRTHLEALRKEAAALSPFRARVLEGEQRIGRIRFAEERIPGV